MKRSDIHPRIRVATTPEEFNECFASGEAFEASHELAAQCGFSPNHRGRDQRRRVSLIPRHMPGGVPSRRPYCAGNVAGRKRWLTSPTNRGDFSQGRSLPVAIPGPTVLIVPGRSGGRS